MPYSIIPLFPHMLDNRVISLEIRFWGFKQETVKRLAEQCWTFSRAILADSCVIRSKYKRRKGFRLKLDKEIQAEQNEVEFSFEADFISSIVFDSKSFRQFDQILQYDGRPRYNLSKDYSDIFRNLFPNQWMREDAIRDGLVKLFSLSGMHPEGSFANHDANGYFMSTPYWTKPHEYHGSYRLAIARECLGMEISCVAEAMSVFAEHMAIEFHNIGATVHLSSNQYTITPYMYYFGNRYTKDGSHKSLGLDPNEWYPYYYHYGVAWFNLLTPMAVRKCTQMVDAYPGLACRILENGGLVVKIRKPIYEADVPDYTEVKKYLYDALLPGMGQVPLKYFFDSGEMGFLAKPRMNWEYMPVFPSEISIGNGYLRFHHEKCVCDHLQR